MNISSHFQRLLCDLGDNRCRKCAPSALESEFRENGGREGRNFVNVNKIAFTCVL
jgi:hypothetical protein